MSRSEAEPEGSEGGDLRQVLLEVQVLKPSVTQLAGLFGAIALTPLVSGLVMYGMKIFSSRHMPSNMLMVGHAMVAFGLPATLAAIYYWYKNRLPLRLLDLGEELAIEVAGELLEGPFRLEHGYTTMHLRGIPMRTLSLLFFVEYEDGEGCVLALSETWGAAHGIPKGWPERLISPGGVPPELAFNIASGRCLRRIKRTIDHRKR